MQGPVTGHCVCQKQASGKDSMFQKAQSTKVGDRINRHLTVPKSRTTSKENQYQKWMEWTINPYDRGCQGLLASIRASESPDPRLSILFPFSRKILHALLISLCSASSRASSQIPELHPTMSPNDHVLHRHEQGGCLTLRAPCWQKSVSSFLTLLRF